MANLQPDASTQSQASSQRQSISFGTLPMKIDTHESNETARAAPAEKSSFPQSPYPWQPRGYPRLAATMAVEPSLAIFRRFGKMNALHLLALQAELQGLEREYHNQLKEDDLSKDDERRRLSSDMWRLHESRPPNARQLEMLEQMRPKLEAYNNLLAQNATLDKMARPLDGNVENLRNWLVTPGCGDGFMDAPTECMTYDQAWRDDFVTLEPQDAGGEARLAKLLNPALIRWYYTHVEWRLHSRSSKRRSDKAGGFTAYKEYLDRRDGFMNTASAVLSLLATLFASLMPVITVLILFFVPDVLHRIGITIGMTVAFGLMLGLFTNSSLKEIFSATIAFAGLEVVFIGTNGVG